MEKPDLVRQLEFIIEIDKIKHIIRKTRLFDGSRYENDAEHSWHIALMAVVLRPYAAQAVNLERVITMLLVHDLVEIDAGDVFLYSPERANAHAAEELAAQRIFGLLPEAEGQHLLAMWREFEDRQSADARFAAAMDRLEPVLQNLIGQGQSWQENHISREQVLEKTAIIGDGAPVLWEYAREQIIQRFQDLESVEPDPHSKL